MIREKQNLENQNIEVSIKAPGKVMFSQFLRLALLRWTELIRHTYMFWFD